MAGCLSGKVVVIMGDFADAGCAIMARLASAGADIAVACSAGADESTLQIDTNGQRLLCMRCDSADMQQLQAFAVQVHQTFGFVDIVIGGASMVHVVSFQQRVLERWPRAGLTIHDHCLLVPQVFLQDLLRSTAGRLIDLSRCSAHYHPQALDAQLEQRRLNEGIHLTFVNDDDYALTVSKVAPVVIRAPSRRRELKAAYLERQLKSQSLCQPLDAEDIATLVVLLASDESDFITGQRFDLDVELSGGGVGEPASWWVSVGIGLARKVRAFAVSPFNCVVGAALVWLASSCLSIG